MNLRRTSRKPSYEPRVGPEEERLSSLLIQLGVQPRRLHYQDLILSHLSL